MADAPFDVVAIGPHPDDLELTCGGTLAKLVRRGYRVGIVDLTDGEPTPRGDPVTRAAEAERARQILGVHARVNLGLPNRVLMDCPEHRFTLAAQLRRWQPRIILGMAGRTPVASPDHHQAHLLVEAARFYSQLTKWDDRFGGTGPYRVPHLVYCPYPFDAEQRLWTSTFVMDISDTFEQKMEAIRAYESQMDAARFGMVQHLMSGINIQHGSRCGFRYGELFAMPAPVGGDDLVRLVAGDNPRPSGAPGQGHLPMG